jgi:uncharacterized lipoprotein YbaY
MRRHHVGAIVFVMMCTALASARGQQTPFRTSVDVVELNVAVFSGKKPVADLTARDFEVTDNRVKQAVLSVSRETEPIDVTMVIDTSESVSETLARAIVTAANRIRERLRPEDRVSLMTFNQRIQERVALLPPPAVSAIDLGRLMGQTSLNDALATVLAQRPVTGRRQMALVFTDGYDSSSFLNEDEVIEVAGRSNTAVFVVAKGIDAGAPAAGGAATATSSITIGSISGRTHQPVAFFHRIADATGGLAQIVSPFNVIVDTPTHVEARANDTLLDDAFLRAFEDFRSSYVLRYSLSGVPRAGWHDLTVKVIKPGKSYQVRARTGYMGG